MSIGLSSTNKISRQNIRKHIDTYLDAGGQITYLAINIPKTDKPSFNNHSASKKPTLK